MIEKLSIKEWTEKQMLNCDPLEEKVARKINLENSKKCNNKIFVVSNPCHKLSNIFNEWNNSKVLYVSADPDLRKKWNSTKYIDHSWKKLDKSDKIIINKTRK